MISFPLMYLLIPFGLVVLFATVFYFFNIFHLYRYAIKSRSTTIVMTGYTLCYLGLLAVSGGYLLSVHWKQQIELNTLFPTFESTTRFGL